MPGFYLYVEHCNVLLVSSRVRWVLGFKNAFPSQNTVISMVCECKTDNNKKYVIRTYILIESALLIQEDCFFGEYSGRSECVSAAEMMVEEGRENLSQFVASMNKGTAKTITRLVTLPSFTSLLYPPPPVFRPSRGTAPEEMKLWTDTWPCDPSLRMLCQRPSLPAQASLVMIITDMWPKSPTSIVFPHEWRK